MRAKNCKQIKSKKYTKNSLALPALHCGGAKKQWEVVGAGVQCAKTSNLSAASLHLHLHCLCHQLHQDELQMEDLNC